MTPVRTFLCLVTAIGVWSGGALANDDWTKGKREMIVLVLIDALRPDHVGAYGYSKPTTPNLDALTSTGRRYTRVYTNAPWTRPSTASYLTGLNASRHGAESAQTKLPAAVVTIAERLREQGWGTAGFCANGNGGSLAGLQRGFQLFEDPTNTYTRGRRGKTYNGLPAGMFVVERALAHLAESTAKKEFVFLFLVDPHDPYRAPARLERLFLGDSYKGKIRRRALWETNNDYPEPERASMLAVYDAAIRYADEAIGHFVAGLRRLGRLDETTLIVTSDHGEGFGEHGFYLHGHHFWEEVVRIPLVVHGSRFAPGTDDRLSQPLDVAATILDLAAVASADLPGRSLLAAPAPHPRVISEYNEFGIHRQAITDGRYKVVWQRPADEARYLREAKKKEHFPSVRFDAEVVNVFDLQQDAAERNDLAAQMPAAAATLLDELRAFVATSGRLAARTPGG